MMSVGMHCRLLGRPGPHRARCSASSTTSQTHDRVWVCRRIDIARHWTADASLRRERLHMKTQHADPRADSTPPARANSSRLLDGIYEHSPWIAAAALARAAVRDRSPHLKHALVRGRARGRRATRSSR